MQKDAEHVLAPVASCYFMGGFYFQCKSKL